ncbi:HDOD domain-containing protein [Tepidicella baoligensis]|uniref:HDOD domain-containing protein n=1 Tax=Tepidicella baoligensis TaxID=2707016 RepID=UPI0015DB8690|nr:HDOD domain-containing protein [Tepidicella baoligensis]
MQLDELLRQPQALPVVPELAARLIETFEQEHVDLSSIAGEIEHDPALVARLLQQANSSFFRLIRPVGTVRDALMVLGLHKVRALVIGAALNDSFHAVSGVNLERFWHFSFAAASVAKLICLPRRLDENVAFTAALLHGVGELVMHIGMPETMQAIDHNLDVFDLNRGRAEYLALGYSYAEAGGALAQHWRLPRLLVDAIAQHANPMEHDPLDPLAAVVHLASWRARLLLSGNRSDDLIHTYPDALGEVLELDPDLLVAPDVAGLDALGGGW